MPRKGWSQLDVPSGWVQIIRGPRPWSVQWPRAPAPQRPQQGSTSRFSEGSSATSSVCADRFRSGAFTFAQPFTRASRRRGTRRSETVGGRHWSSRREQHSREVLSRSPPRRSKQDEVATNSGTGGVLQEFSRTSTQAGSPSPSSDRQGHRTEGSVQVRGANPPPPVVSSLVSELQ